MKIKYTMFGKTKLVEVRLHNEDKPGPHEETLWVERNEDWYALSSPQLRDKKVAIVTREEWLRASEV